MTEQSKSSRENKQSTRVVSWSNPSQNLWDKQHQQASLENVVYVVHKMDVLTKLPGMVLKNRSSLIYKNA